MTHTTPAGRDDYLIFDANGGLDGYMNIRGRSEGQPVWIPQGGAKSIATGLGPNSTFIRMADVSPCTFVATSVLLERGRVLLG